MLRKPDQAAAVTAVDEHDSRLAGTRLSVVEYRPRSHRITWRIDVPGPMFARMALYDVSGREVRTLHDGLWLPGTRVVTWDTADTRGDAVHSGVYYLRLSFEGGVRLAVVPVVR